MNRDEVIARLIVNTRRKKRVDNLFEIAKQIRFLEKELGSLKEVSKTIGISTDQIRQFLSVERMSPKVQNLVKKRKIDLINIVHYMKNFNYDDQNKIAEKLMNGTLTARDIRVIAPLRLIPEFSNIDHTISRVSNSKNIKIYVIYFRCPSENEKFFTIENRFYELLGLENIFSIKKEGATGILEITTKGKKKLQEAAKKMGLTLRQYIASIIKEALS